jgi:hypothetical protein
MRSSVPVRCAGQRVELVDRFELLAEEGEPPGAVLEMGRPDLERIAAHPERSALKCRIVAPVLLGDEVGHHPALVVGRPTPRSWVIAP